MDSTIRIALGECLLVVAASAIDVFGERDPSRRVLHATHSSPSSHDQLDGIKHTNQKTICIHLSVYDTQKNIPSR